MANSAEAQAWVSIGTNLPAKTKGVEKVEEVTIIKQEKDDDVGSEKQLHLDEDALQLEPFASDDFVAGDKFEQEVAENGHETNEEPVSGVGEKQNKEKERERNSNSAKDDEDVGHQTNSNNPQLVRCRIFVGHLNTDKCSRKDVEDLFAPFGKVLACSLQQGYGFVQYETEQSARKAIRELHGVNFFGMKLGTPLYALPEPCSEVFPSLCISHVTCAVIIQIKPYSVYACLTKPTCNMCCNKAL